MSITTAINKHNNLSYFLFTSKNNMQLNRGLFSVKKQVIDSLFVI